MADGLAAGRAGTGPVEGGTDGALRQAEPKPEAIMPAALDSYLGFQQKALTLRAYRQELLASNIANADTPHYKARDIDFKSALKNAMSGGLEGQVGLVQTSPRHLAGENANPFGAALAYRSEFQSAVDGNTVNMDIERAAFAENAIHVEALLTFIRGRLNTMQTALQSQ